MPANGNASSSNKSANQAACVDIKEYLWTNHSDLTSLPTTMTIFLAIYGLIVTLGVLGNTLVVLSVIRHKSLQSVRNMFIVSLSVSDIVISVVSGTITPITAFTKVWIFGELLCYFVPFIQGASLCFSTLTLTAIAIDRYILIIFPTKRPIQKPQAVKMIGLDFTLAAAISLPMFIKQRFVEYENFCGQFCTEDWGSNDAGRSTYGILEISGTIVFVFQFVAPLTASLFKEEIKTCSLYRQQALKRRLRTNRMLIAMVGVFVCCWMPSVVFNFLRDYQWLPNFVNQQEYLIGIITHCISMSSTIWNPCLYTLLNEQFRLAFLTLLQSFRTTRKKPDIRARCLRLMSTAFINEDQEVANPETMSNINVQYF
uniref:G-protein coupled receptors family 1 profile domain-containing protein n=1 Tax=Setaria digitata TaxID=48799 RepID=A0A915Q7F3_9BILA